MREHNKRIKMVCWPQYVAGPQYIEGYLEKRWVLKQTVFMTPGNHNGMPYFGLIYK